MAYVYPRFQTSVYDGQTLVGHAGVVDGGGDVFRVFHNDVTVYTQGVGTSGDIEDQVTLYDGVSGTVVHGEVKFDGTPVPSDPDLARVSGSNFVVQSTQGSTATVVYGSPDRDALAGYGGQVTFYGYSGNDEVDAIWAEGCGSTPCDDFAVTMYGGAGSDWLYDESGISALIVNGGTGADHMVSRIPATGTTVMTGTDILNGGAGRDSFITECIDTNGRITTCVSTMKAFVASTGRNLLLGGTGDDRFTSRIRGSEVRGGFGYDVCKAVRGVVIHGCEKIVRV
jgi:hypothetical protein